MSRPENDQVQDARLRAALIELDAPVRVALFVRALVYAAALRLAAWTAPPEDAYLVRPGPRPVP